MRNLLSRTRRIVTPLLSVAVLLFPLFTQSVGALSAAQRKAMVSGAKYFDVEVGCASSAVNSKLYVLGDSLTVGMRDQGQLSEKLTSNGWTDITIQATSGDNIAAVLPKVDADQTKISEASTAVIGLGTNPDTDFPARLNELVTKIRSYNNDIKLFWINVYSDGVGRDNQQTVNQELNHASAELNFTIINWRGEATANPDAYPFAADHVHHTPEGFVARAAFVTEKIGVPPAVVGGVSGVATTANDLVGDSNEEKIFGYLVGKTVAGQPLKDYHVAGILGNMWAESGYQPQRLQGTPSGTVTTADMARDSSGGWGLVQWTPTKKIIDPTQAAGKDPNDMQVQLDFLLEQLNGIGASPEAAAGELLMATTDVGSATLTFETKYERHAGAPNPARIVEAQRILDQGFTGSGGGGGCGGGDTSDFASTVTAFAWPTPDGQPQLEMKPEYAAATDAAVAAGLFAGGPPPGVDCGGFVTRLMVDSDFEPNYNFGGKIADGAGNVSSGQITWLQANWEKITVSGTQDLQPGDVAVNVGRTHTFVFVGDIPGFSKQFASASQSERTPRASSISAASATASNIEWYRQK